MIRAVKCNDDIALHTHACAACAHVCAVCGGPADSRVTIYQLWTHDTVCTYLLCTSVPALDVGAASGAARPVPALNDERPQPAHS